MKETIFRYARSPKTRIISVFMAFLIFSLTFVHLFSYLKAEGVSGTAADGIIRPIPDNSKYLGPGTSNTNDGEYEYTGKIKPVAISLYDYMTDREITNGWNCMNDNNNPDPAYTYYNRYNPYDTFNRKISTNFGSPGNSTISYENTITVTFEPLSSHFNSVSNGIYVYMYNSSDGKKEEDWPGSLMTNDNGVYTYTFVPKNNPDVLIFNNNGSIQTYNIVQTMSTGNKYSFTESTSGNNIYFKFISGNSSHKNNVSMHVWDNSGTAGNTTWPGWDMTPEGSEGQFTISKTNTELDNQISVIFTGQNDGEARWQAPTTSNKSISSGHVYWFKQGSNTNWANEGVEYPIVNASQEGTSIALDVPNSKLYLGNFLARRPKNAQTDPHTGGDGGDNDDPANYNTSAKDNISPSCNNTGHYNDFYWQANIAQRPVTIWDSTQNKDVKQTDRPYAAIQGLVDDTLTNGKITQNGNALPYFTNDWVSSGVMKAWESTASEPIAFPFYEVLRTADDNLIGYEHGSNTDVTHKAKYYEFNSLDANLQFDSSTKQFKESTTPIKAAPKDNGGTVGFFPFNTQDSWNSSNGASGNKNNYGFGAKFEMTFKLSADGKTDTVDQDGNKITTGAGKVHTRFDFSGDDDIWVFVDDKLVLDMGGDHARVTGYIDFAEKTAVVDKAVTYGTGGVDNVGIDGGSKSVDISSLIDGYDSINDVYNTDTIHTMTIFYMERGMAESNLLIRFNFPPESIYSKMKVKEQTDFSVVNEGLRNLTQKAAETDVFQYYIENKGTTSADVLKENSYFPTLDQTYIRTVQGTQTKLTPTTAIAGNKYFEPVNNGEYEGVKSVSYNWVDEYAKLNGTGDKMSSDKNIGNVTDSSGYMYLMHGVTSSGDAAEVKSSGEFEGQFKRYSLMRVTQQNTLYKPSSQDGNTVATLSSSNTYTPTGTTPSRTVPNYYNLKRNFVFSTVSNEIDISNGSPFNFRNNLQANITKGGGSGEGEKDDNENTTVAMTVQFVNEPKVGSITIKKTVKAPDGTAEDYKGEFTFKLTLSDIFGITGVNPDATNNKYNDIAVKRLDKDNNTTTYPLYKLTDADTGSDYHGEFKLKAGESLVIANVPVQTHYKVEEDSTSTPNYEPSYSPDTTVNNTIVEGKLDESVPVSYKDANDNDSYDSGEETANNSVIVNTHITRGLTLQKIVTASEGSAPAQNFTFRVSLTVPSEVNLSNYDLTSSDSQTIVVNTDSNGIKYFDVTVQGDSSVIVSGLPKGIGYTVSEIDIPENWEQLSATGLTGTIADTNTVTITNRYNKPPDPVIKLTKVDVTSNNALITNPAQFKLLKLKDKDSSNNDIDWTNQTKLTAFNTLINGSGYTPVADVDYIEAVYPDNNTTLSTTSGVLTVTNNTPGVTLTKGSKYIFYEVTAPTGYERDNTVTADKIITLGYGDNFVEYPNSPSPLKVSVKKVDKDDPTKGLPGAEFDLYIHETVKTYPTVESTYKTASIATVPSPSANVPDPLPVLYPTSTNKSVSYEWSEGTSDPDYYYIKFNNTLGWSNVTMNGNTAAKTSGNVYYFKNDSDAISIYFSDGTNRTIDIDISSLRVDTTIYPDAKHGYGYTFKPQSFTDPGGTVHATDASGKYLVQIETPAPTSSNKVSVTEWNSTTTGGYTDYIWFYYGTSNSNMSIRSYLYNSSNTTVSDYGAAAYSKTIGGITHYFYKVPYSTASSYDKIMFFNGNNNGLYATQPKTITADMKGKVYAQGDWFKTLESSDLGNSSISLPNDLNGKTVGEYKLKDVSGLYANAQYFDDMGTTTYSVKTITYPTTAISPQETTVNYSAKYQPEDRYAFITDLSGNTDINNFITIDTAMDDPYIMFYDSSDNAVLELKTAGKPVATAGLKLSVADKDGSDGSPYKIRLPKNAASFVVSSGADHTPNKTSYKIDLYDNTGYHHAGSTFYVKAVINPTTDTSSPDYGKPTGDGQLDTTVAGNGVLKRIGYTSTAGSDITYPINPKTDADYIFFKDTDGSFTSNVCAYYYGDVDGEYKLWPGVPAQRSYVDNDGKTVYVFQPPKSTNGKYSKVIFNDGTASSSRKITTAEDITLRTIYTTSSPNNAYGEQTTAPYSVTTTTKTTTSTTSYTIGSDYIYFNNNGTYNFNTNYKGQARYILDDIHIEFFADLAGTVPVGTASPGYIPDKLSETNVYKIAIPKGAAYFRVNNGEKTTPTATVNNTRQSEIVKITPNGLFQFVEDTDATKVWDGSAAANSISELDDHNYKLKDNFTADSTNIKLATVVTGNTAGHEGEQAYIKAGSLKRKPENSSTVDIEYLDHTAADEGSGAGKKFVKVKKPATTRSSVSEYEESDTYYYWVETVAPADYKLPEGDDAKQKIDMTSTPIAPTTYDSTSEIYTNTFGDEPASGGTVILTKKSKDQVGINPIGTVLENAQFKLVKLNDDGTVSAEIHKFREVSKGVYNYSSTGEWNSDNNTPSDLTDDKWLTTKSNGTLTLNNVPIGSYYLEEQVAPTGYSNYVNGTANKKTVYFSIGSNTTTKHLTCTDEMDAAYIRLFEHINEKLSAWGDPTFIFKITQTKYYDSTGTLKDVPTSKTSLVALTLNDADNTGKGGVSVLNDTYNDWLKEGTNESEYQGVYHIDGQGRIKVEPGEYEITRIPVSRYKFVTSASTAPYPTTPTTQTETTNDTEHDYRKKVIISSLQAGNTVDVHYYDEVEYYDKFSHVDTKVNKFYKLESGQNKTVKGIRISDYRQVGTTGTGADTDADTMTVPVSNLQIYKIYVDGTEELMSSTEKEALTNFNVTYNYTTGDDKKFGGDNTADPVISAQFSYNTTGKQIIVTNVSVFENGVYTLEADYNGFKATFDIVFLKTASP